MKYNLLDSLEKKKKEFNKNYEENKKVHSDKTIFLKELVEIENKKFKTKIQNKEEKINILKLEIFNLRTKRGVKLDKLKKDFNKSHKMENLEDENKELFDILEILNNFDEKDLDKDYYKGIIERNKDNSRYKILDYFKFYEDKFTIIYGFYKTNSYRKKVNKIGVEFIGISKFTHNFLYSYGLDIWETQHRYNIKFCGKDYPSLKTAKEDINKNLSRYKSNYLIKYYEVKNKFIEVLEK